MISRIRLIVHPGYHYSLVGSQSGEALPQFRAYQKWIHEAVTDKRVAVVVVKHAEFFHESLPEFLNLAKKQLKERLVIAFNEVRLRDAKDLESLGLEKNTSIKAIGEYAGSCTADELIRLANFLKIGRKNVKIDVDNSTSLMITAPLKNVKQSIEVLHPGNVLKAKKEMPLEYFLTVKRVKERLNEIDEKEKK